MHAQRLPGRGLTAHYFFTFGVEVQLVGDRKNTKVEQRILHLDVAAPAIKLIEKGSVRVFLRFDGIAQIVFDDVEPRSVLISCRDDRRFFVVFQKAEDNLVFRTACSDLAAGALDMNRFQRSVLKKGQLMKRGRAGALFGDRYAILTPRKLFIMPSKVSVFPSNAVSLEEATPRFDDTRGTIHLDVQGKEYVFQGADKDESQDWFVEIARAATSKAPILLWDDATAAKMQAESADEQQQDDDDGLDMTTGRPYVGGYSSTGGDSPSHFTSPDDWQEEEEPLDSHLDMTNQSNMSYNNRSRSLQGGGSRGASASQQRGFSSWSGGGDAAGFSNPGNNTNNNVIRLGSNVNRNVSPNSGSGGRGLNRSWSGVSSVNSGSGGRPQQQQQQQQQREQQRPASVAGSMAGNALGTIFESGESDLAPSSTEDEGAAAAASAGPRQQQQQQRKQPPPAPPLRLAPRQQHQQQPVGAGRQQSASRASASPAAAAVPRDRISIRQQQQQQQPEAPAPSADGFFAESDDEGSPQPHQQQLHYEQADQDQEVHSGDDGQVEEVPTEDEAEEYNSPAQQQQQQPGSPATGNPRSSIARAAAAAAAGSPRKSAASSPAKPQQQQFAGTGGFMSPGSAVDLEALTDAVTARLEAAQQARSLRNSQLIAAQQQQFGSSLSSGALQQQGDTDSPRAAAAAAAAMGYQPIRSPSPQGQYLDSLAAAAAARSSSPASYQPGSPGLPSVGQYNLHNSGQQQQHSLAAPYQYGYPQPAAAGTTSSPQSSTWNNTQRTVNFGSSPGVVSTSGSGAKPPQMDSTSGWGRKSLAGLYNTKPRAGSSPGSGILGGFTNTSGPATPPATAAATGRTTFGPGSSGSSAGPLPGRLSSSGVGFSANSPNTQTSGVILGEYIIPSVFRVIVFCPEGLELANQLMTKPDMTPHQRNLAMMRWAFGVYNQLPDEARTAVPSGPSRHNLNTWVTPDIHTLTQTIQHTQQQRQEMIWHQQQQAAAQLLQQINQHVTRNPAAAAAGSPAAAAEGAAAAAAAALLASLVQTGMGPGLNPMLYNMGYLTNPMLYNNPMLSNLGLLGPGGVAGPQNVALQQLLAAAAAGKDVSTILQEFGEQQLGFKRHSPDRGARSRSVSPRSRKHKQHTQHKHAVVTDSEQETFSEQELPTRGQRSRSGSPHKHRQQQQQQHNGKHGSPNKHRAAASSSDEDGDPRSSSNRRDSSSSESSENSNASSSCDQCRHETHRRGHSRSPRASPSRKQHSSAAATAANNKPAASALLAPNMNITVRLKRHHLMPAAYSSSRPSDAGEVVISTRNDSNDSYDNYQSNNITVRSASASPGGPGCKGHRLRGRCSFTCEAPVFQVDLAAADAANRARPVSAGAVLGGTRDSSSSSSSRPVRCAAVHLSPAAAQTICRAASTAAAAAAAAVRSAVLTIDGDEPGSASVRPSIQSLVGQVQSGELDASEFVGTVANGRAGGLLRSQY